ncbi:Rossmann-fold NAD(P)-binding domain-containing protein [Rickettsia endosymbiont of Cardiosporidium cionae]|uniref:NAD(P)(+) transhydrogenase (Re/Si-specific) subunit alpha n=1 Tax=Rickettsia endosymbiont of Cardiosporidium cionae TaxID=2777155 RepID=UPI00189461F3|nr:NAD(P)(+) transhydrogenase (Re/Si-specific) subunit alpha [Rickettsia endosymbiont of Cardiosporidium cionae]KAF8818676.1 NAD(P) transhydrogenase subunit alpha [Rickettsia endosymbiont of Cardiosporidium cionae]
MKIIALKEREKNEIRCAITPETAKLFVNNGHDVYLEPNIGIQSNFLDLEYAANGAIIVKDIKDAISKANIILKVRPSPMNSELNELQFAAKNTAIIGMISKYRDVNYIKQAVNNDITLISMELLPRISKVQNMDVLSSQSNLSGYRAVIEGSYHYNGSIPMMMTSAGRINATKILIIGAGVAGLQAIATAKRLGAIVSAYDIRKETEEQVESLGATFLSPEKNHQEINTPGTIINSKNLDANDQSIQENFLSSIIENFNIVITTVQIAGKRAPLIINNNIIDKMKPGSVIIDTACDYGGNVESSDIENIIIKNSVKIIGCSDLANKTHFDSSRLYAKNLFNFLNYAIKENTINMQDDMISSMHLENIE